MDLKTVISDSGRTGKYPTVITDEVFTVSFFNEAAKKLIPDLKTGHSLEEYVTVYDKNVLKRSKYPSSAIIGRQDKKYFCVFCPVISGFLKECVFSIAVPDENGSDECEQYLSMKLAVMSKCLTGKSGGAPAGKERAYGRLYSSYEANMRMLVAMGGNDYSSAVNIKELLEDAFAYYCSLKYGTERTKRYDVSTNCDYIRMKRAVCIILICVYDICQALSRNGFCNISVESDENGGFVSFRFSVLPKHKLASAFDSADSAEDAIYSLLGQGAENMLIVKALVRQICGQADVNYDTQTDKLEFVIKSPTENSLSVRAADEEFATLYRITARMCCYAESRTELRQTKPKS